MGVKKRMTEMLNTKQLPYIKTSPYREGRIIDEML
jgi:hypothetical protein